MLPAEGAGSTSTDDAALNVIITAAAIVSALNLYYDIVFTITAEVISPLVLVVNDNNAFKELIAL